MLPVLLPTRKRINVDEMTTLSLLFYSTTTTTTTRAFFGGMELPAQCQKKHKNLVF